MSDNEPSPDQVPPEETSEGRSIEDHLKSRATWLRLLFMIVLVFLYGVACTVVGAVVLVQFFWVLFTGEKNRRLEGLGQGLASYMYQIVRYLTFIREERPFPFDTDWPSGPPED